MLASLDKGLLRINRGLLVVILGVMAVLVFANVAVRFFTDVSIEWAEELARHLMIWLTFLGGGLVLRYGGHIAIDNLQDALPPFGAQALRVLIVLILTAFFGVMAVLGGQYVLFQWEQTTAVLQLPFGLIYGAMPVGFLLMIYHLAMLARGFVRQRAFAQDEDFDSTMSASL